ncbi:DUF3560 domain-containing protein [Thiotrichales bacterium 19X7-9]|nr:DUF3560 domain-containing protein [Thiotrichales bacterium 19X7-9]
MNKYEQKQEEIKQRYLEKSEKAKKQAYDLYESAKDMASLIPFGQPILVGHHSETSDRNYRAKISNKFDNAMNELKKSEYYEKKARSVGSGGISSQDPEAATKIINKIEELKRNNDYMKSSNKLWRKIYNQELKNVQCEKQAFFNSASELAKTDKFAAETIIKNLSYYAFPPYARIKPFYPDTAEIRRLENRLKSLKKVTEIGNKIIEKNGYKFIQDVEEMYLMFTFEDKPNEDIRSILKSRAFKWSPSRGAWVRKLTNNALYSSKYVITELDKIAN